MALILAFQIFYYNPRVKEAEELRRAQEAAETLAEQEQAVEDSTVAALETEDSTQAGLQPEAATAPGTGTIGSTGAEGLPAAQDETAATITVSSPLYDIALTTTGAVILSARLLDFKTYGEPVQIFKSAQAVEESGADIGMPQLEGVAGLTLLGEEEKLELANVGFTAYLEGRNDPLLDGSTVSLSETNPERTIVFRAEGTNGRVIEKTFTFTNDSYLVRAGVHFSGAQFPFVHDTEWGLGAGLQAVEAHTEDDYRALRANVRLGDEYHTLKRGDFDQVYTGTVQWAALQIKYFTAIVMTEEPAAGAVGVVGDKAENFITASITLPAVDRRGAIDQTVDFYFGPIDYGTLKSFDRGLERNVDMGMAILRPVSRGVLWSLKWLHNFIPNYGLVIIILSVFTKVLFYRLTHKSFKSMRDMQALQPRLQAIKEKYKDDRQKISQETMKLYKEAGVNPLGGCLPMLLQMPVFIALFNVLRNTIELRRAPFFGWITDLSQQDVLTQLPFSLPMIGNAVSVLPIIMGVGMLLQSKIGGGIAGPSSSTTQPKMMTYMMPILFTVLFYRMPSGLVVYWIVNTVMSIGQQYYINKGADKADREKAALEEMNNKRSKPNRTKTKAKGR